MNDINEQLITVLEEKIDLMAIMLDDSLTLNDDLTAQIKVLNDENKRLLSLLTD